MNTPTNFHEAAKILTDQLLATTNPLQQQAIVNELQVALTNDAYRRGQYRQQTRY